MARTSFEDLRVYQLAERLADAIWDMVVTWPALAKATIGEQLVDAADSIDANIAEGSGRGSYRENRRFVRISRGSLYESKLFLRRAYRRKLMTQEQTQSIAPMIEELAPTLNAYLNSTGTRRKATDQRTNDPATDHGQLTTDR
jgi:four helix bundle protein